MFSKMISRNLVAHPQSKKISTTSRPQSPDFEASEDAFERTAASTATPKTEGVVGVTAEPPVTKKKASYEDDDFEASVASGEKSIRSSKTTKTYGSDDFEKEDNEDNRGAVEEQPSVASQADSKLAEKPIENTSKSDADVSNVAQEPIENTSKSDADVSDVAQDVFPKMNTEAASKLAEKSNENSSKSDTDDTNVAQDEPQTTEAHKSDTDDTNVAQDEPQKTEASDLVAEEQQSAPVAKVESVDEARPTPSAIGSHAGPVVSGSMNVDDDEDDEVFEAEDEEDVDNEDVVLEEDSSSDDGKKRNSAVTGNADAISEGKTSPSAKRPPSKASSNAKLSTSDKDEYDDEDYEDEDEEEEDVDKK